MNSQTTETVEPETPKAVRSTGLVSLSCKTCGVVFQVRPSWSDRKYCSQSCMAKAYTKPDKVFKCEQCGAEFVKHTSTLRRFCSNKCSGIANNKILIEGWKNPQIAESRRASFRRAKAGTKPSAATIAGSIKWHKKNTPWWGEKTGEKHRGVKETAEKNMMGVTNLRGRRGIFRSPRGLEYQFRNVTQFVRDNEHLFDESDVVWNLRKGYCCNAAICLLNLLGKGKSTPGSWKGWTVVSIFERRFNDGDDLLERRQANKD